MSNDGPTINADRLWISQEDKCLEILKKALILLRKIPSLPNFEVDLNREFYWCLLSASRELFPESEIPPIYECNNQPDPDDETRATRENKRPDFQWIYLDRYESDSRRSSKQFVVECKRLGQTLPSGWNLLENYVDRGINRFRNEDWRYAQRFSSGAMVGYWQSLEVPAILSEVNEIIENHNIPLLRLSVEGWQLSSVSQLDHSFSRSFPNSPFHLIHLWVDLSRPCKNPVDINNTGT